MLILLTLIISYANEHSFCGHEEEPIEPLFTSSRVLLARSTSLSPIRLSLFFMNVDLGSPALNTQLNSTVLPAVINFFTTSLSVFSIIGNLVLASTACSSISVPLDHITIGVPNTDVIVYVNNISSSSTTYIASASSCQLESKGLNNVVAGKITINSFQYAKTIFSSWIAVLTHELTHLLGLSTSITQYWRNSTGSKYPTGPLSIATVRGLSKTLVTSPNVVAKARELFGCSTIQGIELEEYGASGTPSFHWDRRIMMNEYMTSILHSEPYWSAISLAALQDTGWYTVNYSLTMKPIFGINDGCSFFDSKCIVDGVTANPLYWQDSKASFLCDFLALNRGSSGVTNYTSALPAALQYFQISTQGGSDTYSDYCPYVSAYSNGRCRLPSTNPYVLPNANEVIGVNSRCFISNLILSPNRQPPPYSACYQVFNCTSTSATVIIGNQTLVCPFTGGTFSIPGYTGTITCPPSSILCQDVPCLSMCSAQGVCQGGFCQCFPGFGGDDCSITCQSNCLVCNSDKCLACMKGFSFTDGLCTICDDISSCNICDYGYEDNGICVLCTPPCLTCISDTICTSYSSNGQTLYKCPSGCATCPNNICTSCQKGYSLSATKQCVQCQDKCFGSVVIISVWLFLVL